MFSVLTLDISVLVYPGMLQANAFYFKTSRPAEGEPMEEVVQEMTLDEWKNLQQRNRPKPEFNIRKPESSVPSKAVVIHKSKYSDDVSIAPGIL